MLSRLRAALTPQVAWVLAAILLGICLLMHRGEGENTALEERVSKTLSSVYGAGEVRVVIATRSSQPISTLGMQSKQAELIPCGAVAVAQGADDPWVQAQLTDALCALLGLPASAVSVIGGGK